MNKLKMNEIIAKLQGMKNQLIYMNRPACEMYHENKVEIQEAIEAVIKLLTKCRNQRNKNGE